MRRTALLVLTAVVLAAMTWTVVRRINGLVHPPLPVLGQVPEFSLLDGNGQPVTQAELAGHIWVANFIFTTCPGICPILTAQMAKLARAVPAIPAGGDVRFVSFSVDPANDTPEAMRAYAARYGADPQRWLFLTGSRDALYNLIRDGFHLAVADNGAGEPKGGELITHSDRFALVDGQLRIRAYYHGTEDEVVAQAVRDIDRLRSE